MPDLASHTRASVAVPAKVNLHLRVDGLRSDGYHEIVTIMQTVDLQDRVVVTADGDLDGGCPDAVALALTHDGTPGVPGDESNLVLSAARALLTELDVAVVDESDDVPTLRFDLSKSIPVAAGMAGGSANAAGALIATNAVLSCGFDRLRLRDIAARIGSDVPFCVTGGTSLATGTGTATADVLSRGTFHWVIGMSNEPLGTPEVYAAWDELEPCFRADHSDVLQAVRSGDVALLGHSLHNDLQRAAFRLRPELADAVDAFLVNGALGSIVSGSGPTVVALADNPEHARSLADATADRFDRVAVVSSPAGGPKLRIG